MRRNLNIAHTKDKVKTDKISIDILEMQKYIKKMNRKIRRYQNLLSDLDTLEISYEQFFQNQSEHGRQIANFLNVPVDQEMQCDLQKITSDDLSKVIENWDEVVASLSETEFQRFLVK